MRFINTKATFYLLSSLFLAVVFSFILSPAAKASIKVEGIREFRDEVNECLSTYRNTPGLVGDTIKELDKSSNEHRIVNNPSWCNSANDIEKAGNGEGTGSVTKVDKAELEKFKEAFPELKNKDFCTALLHELSHAADADRGERDIERVDGVKKNEIRATMFQNFLHAIRGVDPRTSYGGKDISKYALIEGGSASAQGSGEAKEEKKEEPKEEPEEEKKEQTEETVKINVVEYNGVYIPVDVLKVYTKEECSCCDSDHFHAPNGTVKSVDGKIVTDPYSNCGLGKTSDVKTIEILAQ